MKEDKTRLLVEGLTDDEFRVLHRIVSKEYLKRLK